MLNVFEAAEHLPEPRKIGPDEAREASTTGQGILLDVRDAHLFENAHLESAVALPLAEIQAREGHLPARIPVGGDPLLILYCA